MNYSSLKKLLNQRQRAIRIVKAGNDFGMNKNRKPSPLYQASCNLIELINLSQQSLSDKERQTIKLCYEDNLSGVEAAHQMKCSRSQFYYIKKQATQKMALVLDQHIEKNTSSL